MNILASVYACSPYDGSERAVGWNWLVELNRHHKITALTSSQYRKDIEDYLSKDSETMKNTHFVYIDVPNTTWHVGYRLERLYYILWQKQAVKIAKNIIKKEKFDLVHHITYVTCVLPTEMYKLGIPFLYGPVSGGENVPSIIGYPMSMKNRLAEFIRSCAQVFFRSTLNFAKTMKGATLILSTTEETKKYIPQKYHDKVEVFQSIGLTEDIFFPEPQVKKNNRVRFLMAGRMLYWKGFELGISAFINALSKDIVAELVILGDTESNPSYEAYQNKLKKMCGNHLDKDIFFISKVDHSKMKEFYDGFDVLINCSLRDSGCFVVMEAMSRALPIIVVNTGGPKVNTTEKSAIKIDPAPMKIMMEQISSAIYKLAVDEELRVEMGKEARKHASNTFLIKNRTHQMGLYYERIIKEDGNCPVC